MFADPSGSKTNYLRRDWFLLSCRGERFLLQYLPSHPFAYYPIVLHKCKQLFRLMSIWNLRSKGFQFRFGFKPQFTVVGMVVPTTCAAGELQASEVLFAALKGTLSTFVAQGVTCMFDFLEEHLLTLTSISNPWIHFFVATLFSRKMFSEDQKRITIYLT